MSLPLNYIAIEGCIAAGKTTLARMVADHYDAELVLEAFEKNPYLERFYADPERHAFPLELYFTAERYQHMKDVQRQLRLFAAPVVADYVFYKSSIFAHLTLSNDDDKRLFDMLFRIMYPNLVLPDLILYLHQPVDRLMENVRRRGRPYEQDISADYLRSVQEAYLAYFHQEARTRIVVVDAADLDFVARPEDFEHLRSILEEDHPIGISYR